MRCFVSPRLYVRVCALFAFFILAAHGIANAAPSISPTTITLAPGGTQKFSTSANGKVQWRATGGTITSSGVFTAGSTPGTFKVTVTKAGSTSTAAVTIAAPAAPTPVEPAPTPTVEPAPALEPAPTPVVEPTPAPTPTDSSSTGSGVTVFAGDAVPIAPGESIQAAVDSHAEGTTFLIKAGVHRRQSLRPKHGMSFIGEPGAILDGENATPRAIVGEDINNVTVRGLRITRYIPPTVTAALDAIDTTGWLVENNEIDHNTNGLARAYGLRLGSSMIVRNNRIHNNGYVGISGYKAFDTLIEANEVYANPPALREDSIGEAANMKCYGCGRLIVRNNYFHDSPFRGIWIDKSAPDITIEGNRIVNHGQPGIWYEHSYQGVIRNNYVENAGFNGYYSSGWLRGGGITVTNSPDVTVTGNTVVNSLNGIIGLQASSYADGPYGKSELRNLLVKGNIIVMQRGQSGIAENIGNSAVFLSWNNRFEGNRYELYTAAPFFWQGQSINEAQWQAAGQDVSASLSSFSR